MFEFKLPIRDGLHLSSIRESDKDALLEHLQCKEIYDTTLNIPYPYTEADADFWIYKRIEATRKQGIEVTFAIRDQNDKLIGGIGADTLEIPPKLLGSDDGVLSTPRSHRVEFGYWLARGYWGQGIMTAAVGTFARYAFSELKLLRLTAHVFENNLGSSRVLEKNGFTLEGHLRQHFVKDGRLIDARVYGLLKSDLRNK